MVDLFKKFNLDKEKVAEWARKAYSNVVKAEGTVPEPLLNLMAQLYVTEVLGEQVEASDVETITGPFLPVSDLKEGEWASIQVAVGKKIRETTYMGCPICYRSLPKEGPSNCKVDGPVEPKAHTWSRYISADSSGEMMISTPPRISTEYKDLMGSVIRARGVLSDQGEFRVQAMNIVPGGGVAVAPLEEKAKEMADEADVQLFNNMLNTFPSMSSEDLEKWHKYQKIKTPLSILLAKSGAEEFEEEGKKRYRVPRTIKSENQG